VISDNNTVLSHGNKCKQTQNFTCKCYKNDFKNAILICKFKQVNKKYDLHYDSFWLEITFYNRNRENN
jgi:hypothetical protein